MMGLENKIQLREWGFRVSCHWKRHPARMSLRRGFKDRAHKSSQNSR